MRSTAPSLGASIALGLTAAVGAVALGVASRAPATSGGAFAGALAALMAALGWGRALAAALAWIETSGFRTASAAGAASGSRTAAPLTSRAPGSSFAVALPGWAALGVAGFIVVGTALGHLGLAPRATLIGLVLGGLGAAAVTALLCELWPALRARRARRARRAPGDAATSDAPPGTAPAAHFTPALLGLALAAAGLLLAIEANDLIVVVADGENHALAIARLWQTGELAPRPGQLGGLFLGQAWVALGGGVRSAGLFDAGLCAALVILLFASACARPGGDGRGLALWTLLALPIALQPETNVFSATRWSSTLFVVAALLRLAAVYAPRADADADADRTDSRLAVLVFAAALVALRAELSLMATALVAAALFRARPASTPSTPSTPDATSATPASATARLRAFLRAERRALALLGVWLLTVTALLLLRGQRPLTGPVLVVAFLLALFLVHHLIPLLGFSRWRDEVSWAFVGAVGTSLQGAALIGGPTREAAFAVWFGAFAIALLRAFVLDDDRARRWARLRGPMGLLLAGLLGFTFLTPNLQNNRRRRFIERPLLTLGAVDQLRAGFEPAGNGLAELQAKIPPGAAVGFWGRSPTGLDFAKNPIADLSWGVAPEASARRGRALFLSPITPRALAAQDYLLVEGVHIRAAYRGDPWRALPRSTTAEIDAYLDLIAESRSSRLFRVRRAPSPPSSLSPSSRPPTAPGQLP